MDGIGLGNAVLFAFVRSFLWPCAAHLDCIHIFSCDDDGNLVVALIRTIGESAQYAEAWLARPGIGAGFVECFGGIWLLYRAISIPHYHALARNNIITSDIGIAQSKNGYNFFNRKKFIIPEKNWEQFGCEDPRVTKLNDKYFIFYTALSKYPFQASGIKVGLAISKDLKNIQEKHLVTPFNAKAMALFPEKINGQIWAILSVHTDKPPTKICLVSFNKESDIWSEKFWNNWYANFEKYALPLQRNKNDFIEVGTPPLKTKYGWLIFYSYIYNYFSPNRLFGIEAVLLDLKNPFKILARTEYPILTAEEYYEKIEELNWIRKKLIANVEQNKMEQDNKKLLKNVEDELLHLKLLQ